MQNILNLMVNISLLLVSLFLDILILFRSSACFMTVNVDEVTVLPGALSTSRNPVLITTLLSSVVVMKEDFSPVISEIIKILHKYVGPQQYLARNKVLL